MPRKASTSAIRRSTSEFKSAVSSEAFGGVGITGGADVTEGDDGSVDGGDDRFEGEEERGVVLEDRDVVV